MYLLILLEMMEFADGKNTFTSHYVSINSNLIPIAHTARDNLHPTMYLLIPTSAADFERHGCIYIPLCIY